MTDLRSNIAQAEGCRLCAYRDSVGVWTIGYGHTPARDGMICTQEQAEKWLDGDIDQARALVAKLPEAQGLDPVRTDALVELMFNLGPAKWKLFVKTRAALADKEWFNAHNNLLNSLWASQVGKTRSSRIADMILTGSYHV